MIGKPEGVRETLWFDWTNWCKVNSPLRIKLTWGINCVLEGTKVRIRLDFYQNDLRIWDETFTMVGEEFIFTDVELDKNGVPIIDLLHLQNHLDEMVVQKTLEE